MTNYGVFALYYDRLTKNVNYPGYARRVDSIIKTRKPDSDSVIDAACGTASLGIELFRLGYKVYGADISENMINSAKRKFAEIFPDSTPLLSVQDIRFLKLPQCDAAVCSLDAVNHLGGIDDVKRCFVSVRRCLKPGGLFIFDVNTPYKHRRVLAGNRFIYDTPEVKAVWQNRYLGGWDCRTEEYLRFYDKLTGEKFSETIVERAYHRSTIKRLLKESGFGDIEEYNGLTELAPVYDTERILYAARRI